MNDPRRSWETVGMIAAIAAALPFMAAMALPFWYGCGVMKRCDGGWLWLEGGIATMIAMVAVAVCRRVARVFEARADRAMFAANAAEGARRHAEHEAHRAALIAELAADPAMAPWIPAVRRLTFAARHHEMQWDARYRAVLADPARRWAAPRLLAGEMLTDRQIDYLADPAMTVTCPHLQALERAMRNAGVPVLPVGDDGPDASANVTIDQVAARRRYAPSAHVVFESYEPHPSAWPEDALLCTADQSRIHLRHGPVAFPPPASPPPMPPA